ncbi:GNAT family N-acetyltransferase [Sphingopyxis sp.]|uniref:GNAT family N-acetyltransferase n=1 Tax=Sphingopyxis sp. TaxID=1908224 RepID=UPI001D3951D5|nr:GNAT family N-acetyltransferase [Sphingopyxis sp.]MBW8296403.1 GNAT family N-acetyltransferase [Sphingopyxis sp.]
MLGIGESGLTATAQEVEAYLRGRALGTWKLSAETTSRAQPAKKKDPVEPRDEPSPVRRRAQRPARAGATETKARRRAEAPPKSPRSPAAPVLRIVAKEGSKAASAPNWHIRPAIVADAAALAVLLRQIAGARIERGDIAANIASLKRTKGGLVVAERDGVIGCCAWVVMPTIHRGLLGRLTLLLVDKRHRRSGIASAMMEPALEALASAGCGAVEAMSDIMIDNAHNFFRKRGYDQKSYRFVRALAD